MVEIRFVEPAEMDAYRDAISYGFGQEPTTDEAEQARWRAVNPAEMAIAAFDRGRMVATFGSYDLQITLPGGAAASMAGTTHVTVHPTHRRQGILTRMMRMHLDQAIEAGRPLAGLWSSDERIYGRFGYGPAVFGDLLNISAGAVEFPDVDSDLSVHGLTVDQARVSLPAIYDRQVSAVAGRLGRSEPWWEARFFNMRPHRSARVGTPRFVVAERDGVEVGYVMFRLDTPENFGEGVTRIEELVASDEPTRRALWSFVTNIDLFRHVTWANAPVDEPLDFEVDRFRQLERSLNDTVWLRPLDVASLLSARSYERDGKLVIGVVDGFGPTKGRYRLEADGGVGVCESATDRPDVELAVEDLGRLLLGGGSAFAMHRAGLVDGDPAKVKQLDDLLNTQRQPHSLEIF